MTETNMNTSNPYDGERRAGTVGRPLPGVEVRVVDARVRGDRRRRDGSACWRSAVPNVFAGYWRQPERPRRICGPDGSSSPATW